MTASFREFSGIIYRYLPVAPPTSGHKIYVPVEKSLYRSFQSRLQLCYAVMVSKISFDLVPKFHQMVLRSFNVEEAYNIVNVSNELRTPFSAINHYYITVIFPQRVGYVQVFEHSKLIQR